MKFNNTVTEYLHGKKFSNSLTVDIPYYQAIPNRIDLVTQLCSSKRVIHLGCLDHLPLIKEKVARNQWLHKRITEASAACIGVDINTETRNYVEKEFGITNVIIHDITGSPINEIVKEKWDYAILGELLEHIDNPVNYLTRIKNNYKGSIDKIVITVPNAFTANTFRAAYESKEVINSDHRYWFTPYTIAKVMHEAGIEVDEILFANRVKLSFMGLVKKKIQTLLGITPKFKFYYGSSIVAIGKL